MSKRTVITIVTIVIVVVLGIGIWLIQKQPQKYTGPVEKVTMGIQGLLPSLVYIAQEKGYFLEQGVDMELKVYPTGKHALEATLKGEVDTATVADVPIVSNSFKRNDFAVFSTIIDSVDHIKVLARKDRNINTPRDLIGKKIATTRGTSAHFLMNTFLTRNGIALSDLKVINLKPKEMSEAILNGKIDAVIIWEPTILEIKKSLGDNAIVLSSKGLSRVTFNLASKKDFIGSNPELIKKILKALVKAERFIKEKREESVDIVTSHLEVLLIDRDTVESLWNSYNFRLSLHQSLILTLEDEARWAINNNLTNATNIPNYLDFIYIDALEAVKPRAMTIIR